MARNGAGTYSLPAAYKATTGEDILASQHNTPLEDLETDANTARPVAAGGTGAITAANARTNLSVYSKAESLAVANNLSDLASAATARTNLGLGSVATTASTAYATAAQGTLADGATQATDLASTANGKGASTVGVEDADGNFTGTNVEAALAELYGFLLGVGESWTAVTRVGNTAYQNTTGKPIMVAAIVRASASSNGEVQVADNAAFTTNMVSVGFVPGVNASPLNVSFILPPGKYYRANTSLDTNAAIKWAELR